MAISRGAENSLTTRYFNAFLLSESILSFEPWEFYELISETSFTSYMAYKIQDYDFFDVTKGIIKNNLPISGYLKEIHFKILNYEGSCQKCLVRADKNIPDILIVNIFPTHVNSSVITEWLHDEQGPPLGFEFNGSHPHRL